MFKIICWSDSLDNTYWIKGDNKRGPLFIENRVKGVHNILAQLRWRHCPGKLNPADLTSRGTILTIFNYHI